LDIKRSLAATTEISGIRGQLDGKGQ